MRRLESLEEVRRLLKERPEQTTTYSVPEEFLVRLPPETKLRESDAEELEELAKYLGASPKELAGPFRVVDANCESCNRRITFLDFVQTAVDMDAHPREELRAVLTGEKGAWLTIRGRDGGRPVICGGCGKQARMPAYSEYSSSSYAYA